MWLADPGVVGEGGWEGLCGPSALPSLVSRCKKAGPNWALNSVRILIPNPIFGMRDLRALGWRLPFFLWLVARLLAPLPMMQGGDGGGGGGSGEEEEAKIEEGPLYLMRLTCSTII